LVTVLELVVINMEVSVADSISSWIADSSRSHNIIYTSKAITATSSTSSAHATVANANIMAPTAICYPATDAICY
jgi:hypothetical protein